MAIIYLPSLVALLLKAEGQKGGLLTRQEAETLRDRAIQVSVPDAIVRYMETAYGYPDFDPILSWETWSTFRAEAPHQPG